MNVTFTRKFFAFPNSGLSLVLGKAFLLSIISLLVVIHSYKIRIHSGRQTWMYLGLSQTSTI